MLSGKKEKKKEKNFVIMRPHYYIIIYLNYWTQPLEKTQPIRGWAFGPPKTFIKLWVGLVLFGIFNSFKEE